MPGQRNCATWIVLAVAAAGGLPICRHGVGGETGITTLASLQIMATIVNQTDGHQVMHQLNENDTVPAEDLIFEGGDIQVPDRPGLGIRLDRDAVDHYAKRFVEKGPFWPC